MKAQASLRICTVSPEPSLFTHMKYGSRRRVLPKVETSSPTGWLPMRFWRMNLRRTKSAIISWQLENTNMTSYGVLYNQSKMSRHMTKPTKWPVHPAKTQISLGICPVWLVFIIRMKKPWLSLGLWLSLERTLKTLIRLGGCPGWSESSLGVQIILLVLSCSGLNTPNSSMKT